MSSGSQCASDSRKISCGWRALRCQQQQRGGRSTQLFLFQSDRNCNGSINPIKSWRFSALSVRAATVRGQLTVS